MKNIHIQGSVALRDEELANVFGGVRRTTKKVKALRKKTTPPRPAFDPYGAATLPTDPTD